MLFAACGRPSEPSPPPTATAASDDEAQPTEIEPAEATETEPAEPDGAAAVPLLDLDDGVTWNEVLDAIVSVRERECIADTIDDEDLPQDFLDLAVFSQASLFGAWPTWHREIVGIDIGDNHWPHQVWRCLDAATASAVYVSVRLEEISREGLSVSDDDTACITGLPTDTEFQQAVSDRLGSEHSFPDGEDPSGLLGELDLTVDAKLLPCMSEAVAIVIESALTALYGDALSGEDRSCLVSAIVDEATSGGLDPALLFSDDTSDAYLDDQLFPVMDAALETCGVATGPDESASASSSGQLVEMQLISDPLGSFEMQIPADYVALESDTAGEGFLYSGASQGDGDLVIYYFDLLEFGLSEASLYEYAAVSESQVVAELGASALENSAVLENELGIPVYLVEYTDGERIAIGVTFLIDGSVAAQAAYRFPYDRSELARELAYYSFDTLALR